MVTHAAKWAAPVAQSGARLSTPGLQPVTTPHLTTPLMICFVSPLHRLAGFPPIRNQDTRRAYSRQNCYIPSKCCPHSRHPLPSLSSKYLSSQQQFHLLPFPPNTPALVLVLNSPLLPNIPAVVIALVFPEATPSSVSFCDPVIYIHSSNRAILWFLYLEKPRGTYLLIRSSHRNPPSLSWRH